MATWIEKSRSPEYSPAKLSQMLAEVESVIGIAELDEAMAGETIIAGGYLNTHLIKANSILAKHMDVGSLSAISANIGEVTSGTITGATVRTSAGADRVQLTNSILETYLNNVKRIQLDYDSLDFYTPGGRAGGSITSIDEQPEYYGPNVTDLEIKNDSGFITLRSGLETGDHSIIRINKELPEHWGSVDIHSGNSDYGGSIFAGFNGVSLARANGVQPGTVLEVTESGIECLGDFTVYNGTKAATVDTKDYGMRKLYALETPDNRFVTYIETKLEIGKHFIKIEPMFKQTISDYFVVPHIQNMSNVSIIEREEGGFTVLIEEKDAEVVFEVNGKRIGYEDIYMEEVIQNKQTDRINGGVKR